MPKAYSYLRFSTPEQREGDSLRRQINLARSYAMKHGLELDESTYQDLGVSAYRGKNASAGKLREFLEAVEIGAIEKGSYLLVESLDRISRAQILQAQALFIQIVSAGITLVTLTDERAYSEETLGVNPYEMFISLGSMIRANDESATKGRRLKEAWKAKRATAGARKLTAVCPSWLRLKDDRETFDVIPERAKVVKRIYAMTLKGIGQNAIAKALNAEGVETFGRPGAKGKMWHRTYIAKLLASAAVIGTMVPHTQEYVDGKKQRKPQEPVPHYYPPIVSEEAYQRVQSLRLGASNPQRGRHAAAPMRNILGGLARCPVCESTMTVVNKGKRSRRAFVCTKAKVGAGCTYRSVPYDDIEAFFVNERGTIIEECPTPSKDGSALQRQWEQLRANIEGTTNSRDALLESLEKAGRNRPASVIERIREHDEALAQLQQEEREVVQRIAATSSPLVSRKLERLNSALAAKPLNQQAVNVLLRQLLAHVDIHAERDEVTLHWQHGGSSEHSFRWMFPKEPKAATKGTTRARNGQQGKQRSSETSQGVGVRTRR